MTRNWIGTAFITGLFGLLVGFALWWSALDAPPGGGVPLVAPAFAQGQPPPVADAGLDRTVAVGETVALDGSGSTDPKEMVDTFAWQLISVPAGSTAALDDPTAVKPSFVADLPGDYVAQLILTEGNRTSQPDSVTVSTVNSAPVADAGLDLAVAIGTAAELDGSRSTDVDGDPLAYD